jgi:hypothetical protein
MVLGDQIASVRSMLLGGKPVEPTTSTPDEPARRRSLAAALEELRAHRPSSD